jgi:cell division septation protein DedD
VQSEDDGYREIQLSGKQLVFAFMAATVVLVVAFLSGVLVGRGVRAERAEAVAQAEAVGDAAVAAPEHTPIATPPDADPTKAPPPIPAESPDADAKAAAKSEPVEEPPVAVKRPGPNDIPPAVQAKPSQAQKPAQAASSSSPVAAVRPAAATPAATAAAPAADAAVDTAPANRNGYAVQVAAVNVRGEADAIVKRLSGKGYSAYVEQPKGSTAVFRVRVGTFKTRREAQTIADKLKKEEKFKPWVTR